MENLKMLPFYICLLLTAITASCTLSFSNIDTHGKASDLIDEQLKSDADITAQIPKVTPL